MAWFATAIDAGQLLDAPLPSCVTFLLLAALWSPRRATPALRAFAFAPFFFRQNFVLSEAQIWQKMC
jgi:hypothetical protein